MPRKEPKKKLPKCVKKFLKGVQPIQFSVTVSLIIMRFKVVNWSLHNTPQTFISALCPFSWISTSANPTWCFKHLDVWSPVDHCLIILKHSSIFYLKTTTILILSWLRVNHMEQWIWTLLLPSVPRAGIEVNPTNTHSSLSLLNSVPMFWEF